MNEMILSVSHVYKTWENKAEKTEVLSDIAFSLVKGEFVTIIGPSGCGKSTLLSMIAGFETPTLGKILMHGREIRCPDWRRGLVFQEPALYPWLNVRDNIAFGVRMRGFTQQEIEQKTAHYIKATGLEGFERYKPYELSGGMRHRVALARVLVNEPELILMDEPFSALDEVTRRNMHKLVNELWKQNQSTVILVTHDIEEALRLGTRTIVLGTKPGKIRKDFLHDGSMLSHEEIMDILSKEEQE